MVLQIPESSALLLGGSADSMADLPQQAFALTLSDDVLERMIESVRNGQEIQLSLGDTPSFLFSGQELAVEELSPSFEYELYHTNSTSPTTLSRLPNPAMPILSAKNRNTSLLRRALGADKPKPTSTPLPSKHTRPQNAPARPQTQAEKEKADVAALSARFQQAEAEKLENSTRILEGNVQIKGGKLTTGKGKLLARPSARSQPGSPALSGVGSPSLGPTSQAQEKAKRLRFPLIHELAVRDLSFGELLPKWQGETDADFHTHLEKVAHFDDGLQKWTLKQQCWKELDVWAYPYKREDDRQRAIENAIKKYDRLRLGVSDPLWQKLLPVGERGRGICLSKVQAAILKGAAPTAPKINVQAPEISSPSVDSEKEDSGSSSGNKAMGGEPMSRSNSGNKTKNQALAQQKLLMSGKPLTAKAKAAAKPTSKPSSAKTSPKVSPTKPTSKPAPKAATGKGGRILSKEFISDSETDSSSEGPLAKKLAPVTKKAQETRDARSTPKVRPLVTDKPKATDKSRDTPVPKTKPAPAKSAASSTPKIMDSIRAERPNPKPISAPKRAREEDDDSSSSGTPLSKRFKTTDHAPVSKARPTAEPKQHRKSDSSQDRDRDSYVTEPSKQRKNDSSQASTSQLSNNGRNSQNSSGTTSIKPKTSPVKKSSPLASSPPTNASDIAIPRDDRKPANKPLVSSTSSTALTSKKRKLDATTLAKAAEKNPSADRYEKSDSSDRGSDASSEGGDSNNSTSHSNSHSNSSSSSSNSNGMMNHRSHNGKRQKVSAYVREQASKFKLFYSSYEALHRELSALEEPPAEKVGELLEMHDRLARLKRQINAGVEDAGGRELA